MFQDLENRFGTQKALELYALTETPEYKDSLLFDLDSNGEMTTDSFIKFTLRREATRDYILEGIDLQHKISSDQLVNLDRLYVNGAEVK